MSEPPDQNAVHPAQPSKRAPRREANLEHAAAHEPPSVVEAALGRFRGEEAAAAARRAAATALAAARWDNLAYLADFLADTTARPAPRGGEGAEEDENEDDPEDVCGCSGDSVQTDEGELTEPVLVNFAVPVSPPDGAVEGILQYEVQARGSAYQDSAPSQVSAETD